MTVAFRVLGVPKPQGSKKAFDRGGRAVLVESAGIDLRSWRDSVAWTAVTQRPSPALSGPLLIKLSFRLPRPKSARKGAVWADRRPDIDKLARATLDALTDSGLIEDDARVCQLILEKVLSEPDDPWTGCDITVSELVS